MDDVSAVMDAVGLERAAIAGAGEASPMAELFAATYPERTSALVLLNPTRAPQRRRDTRSEHRRKCRKA